jgi:hypothetical protein
MELDKPLCDFSNFRANVCEMRGNIRIHPNASSIMYTEPVDSKRDEQWKLKPYPRKGDELFHLFIARFIWRGTEDLDLAF